MTTSSTQSTEDGNREPGGVCGTSPLPGRCLAVRKIRGPGASPGTWIPFSGSCLLKCVIHWSYGVLAPGTSFLAPGSCLPSSGNGMGMTEIKLFERLVPVSFAHCWTSTSGLSTWWSSTALRRDLVLRGASRLDAFSGYPVRT